MRQQSWAWERKSHKEAMLKILCPFFVDIHSGLRKSYWDGCNTSITIVPRLTAPPSGQFSIEYSTPAPSQQSVPPNTSSDQRGSEPSNWRVMTRSHTIATEKCSPSTRACLPWSFIALRVGPLSPSQGSMELVVLEGKMPILKVLDDSVTFCGF